MKRVTMLRKTDGTIYPYTDALAERPDMQEVSANPEDYSDYEVVSTGEKAENEVLKGEITALEDKNLELRNENDALRKILADAEIDVDDTGADEIVVEIDLEEVRAKLDGMTKEEIEAHMREFDPPYEVDRRMNKDTIIDACLAHLETPAPAE